MIIINDLAKQTPIKHPSQSSGNKVKGEHMNVEVTIYTPGEDAEPAIEGTQEEVRQTLVMIERNIDRIAEKAAECGVKKMIFHPTYFGAEEGEKVSVRLDDGTGKAPNTTEKFRQSLSADLHIRVECCEPFQSDANKRVHIAGLDLVTAYWKDHEIDL